MYFKRGKTIIKSQKRTVSTKGFVISGIYTQRELHAIVSYERARSDRENTSFSILHIHVDSDLANNRNRTVGFLNNLRRIIRDIDHLGWWDNETFAVLLPSTKFEGAQVCAQKLEQQLSQLGYDFSLHLYSYPDHWLEKTGGKDEHSSTANKTTLHYEKIFTKRMPVWKRSLDIAGSLTALLILSPLFLFTALFIKMVSPGGIIFTQKRVGFRGIEFDFYKFRSMHQGNNQAFHGKHAEDFIKKEDVPMLKLDDYDPRIIPGGKIMRKLCVDELPQLINVLKGDMSLVGPRPCIPYEKESYLRWHTHRFDVVPGMTGLWQVSGKNKLTFKQMIRLDIAYCRNLSPYNDLKIIFLTIPAILKMVLESVESRMRNRTSGEQTDSEEAVNEPSDSIRANA
ncbi:MAG: sugar transferase [Spirochaetales bacterium]|nr:sugar transferase [Spirochaetales bacterium]